MKNRSLVMGFVVIFGCLLILQGCMKGKIYTTSKHGAQTANLIVPNFIEIGSLDGESVENLFSRIIYEGEREVVFPAGTHSVELRYNDMWDIDDNDHEKIISRYITLRFDAKPGDTYKIGIDAPKDRESAWRLASHFNAAIVNARTGKTVSHSNGNP